MAHGQPHLTRRGAIYWFIRRLPKPRTPREKGESDSFLRISLRTDFLPDARLRSARLTALTDYAGALLETAGQMMDTTTFSRVLRELARFEIAAADQARAHGPRRSHVEAEAAFAREAAIRETLREAIMLRDHAIARAPLVSVCRRLGVELPQDPQRWGELSDAALRLLIEISQTREDRDRGQFDASSAYLTAALDAVDRPSRSAARAAAQTALPQDAFAVSAAGSDARYDARCDVRPASDISTAPSRDPAPAADTARGADASTACAPAETAAPARIAAAAVARDGAAEASPAPLDNAPAPTLPAERLSEAFDRFINLRVRGYTTFAAHETPCRDVGKSWLSNSAANARATKELCLSLLGDVAITELNDAQLLRFKSRLHKIPAAHGKSRTETRPILTIIAQNERQQAKKLKALEAQLRRDGESPGNIELKLDAARIKTIRINTVIRHLRELARVLDCAVARGALQRNPLTPLMYSQKEISRMRLLEEDHARRPWDDTQLAKLYASPIYQDAPEDPGDPLYWAPLIARCQGMREEEVLQLHVENFRRHDGVDIIHIVNGAGQTLKSEAARRSLPIHQALIDLGLLEVVELRRRQGELRLFPYQKRGRNKGKLSENFTKTFAYYRQSNGCYWKGQDFHAFRTGFHGALVAASVQDSVCNYLMGHIETNVGIRHYLPDGFPLARLRDAINTVPADFSSIRRPFEPAASPAQANPLRVVGGKEVQTGAARDAGRSAARPR